jgi:hypothetical protein
MDKVYFVDLWIIVDWRTMTAIGEYGYSDKIKAVILCQQMNRFDPAAPYMAMNFKEYLERGE